jgi:nucleoside phosphorylase
VAGLLVVAATSRELGTVAGDVATLRCGIGPVEAAAATARALARDPAAAVLHVGLAGARTLSVGALVLGTEAVYCDVAAAVPVVDRVAADAGLLAAAREALPGAAVLPIGTSASVGGAHGAEVEAMEGFAVLRAAGLAGVPALELRAISNAIGEDDRSKWRLDDALEALRAALPAVVRALAA